jgi:hypothetical protein
MRNTGFALLSFVAFEVLTAVTRKNGAVWSDINSSTFRWNMVLQSSVSKSKPSKVKKGEAIPWAYSVQHHAEIMCGDVEV